MPILLVYDIAEKDRIGSSMLNRIDDLSPTAPSAAGRGWNACAEESIFGLLKRPLYTPATPARPDIFVAGRFPAPRPCQVSRSQAYSTNLTNGDVITISGLGEVTMTPK